MRFLRFSIVCLAAALAIAACSSKSSSNDNSSSSTEATAAASAATDTSGGGGMTNAAASTAPGEAPAYPGATTQASGSSSNMGQSAAGSVMSTDDSFDKVYGWYQQNMPAGSEKAHTTSPTETAVFTIGDPGKGQTSVTITTQGGKTMITTAHVKM